MVSNPVIRRPCWCTKLQWQVITHILLNNRDEFPKYFALFCSVHTNMATMTSGENHLLFFSNLFSQFLLTDCLPNRKTSSDSEPVYRRAEMILHSLAQTGAQLTKKNRGYYFFLLNRLYQFIVNTIITIIIIILVI